MKVKITMLLVLICVLLTFFVLGWNTVKNSEKDNFSKLPGSAYTIGYIRSYSNFLNLDAKEIAELYKDQIFSSNKKEPIKISHALDGNM